MAWSPVERPVTQRWSLPHGLSFRIQEDIRDRQLMGRNGRGDRKPYVPHESLFDYWTITRINEVLHHLHLLADVTASVIRNDYIRVFTTLVDIDQVDYLPSFTQHSFNDSRGPLYNYKDWPKSFREGFSQEFERAAWKFFPFKFSRNDLYNRRLSTDYILPIDEESVDLRKSSASVKLSKITIHRTCNELEAPPSGVNTFILKQYMKNMDTNTEYRREQQAYNLLQSTGSIGLSDHVAKYYGSFEQEGTQNLVLEFVHGQTFDEYLSNNNPPQTPEDTHDFWTSVTGIFKAVFEIHKIRWPEGTKSAVIHQDLKFDNMLVSMTPGLSPYKFQMKLIDFGCSSVAKADAGDEEPRSYDTHGNATNSPPETTHHHPDFLSSDLMTRAYDIWSLGCTTFNIGCWVAGGSDNMDTCRNFRKEELRSNPRFSSSSHVEGFHNGAEVLHSVNTSHQLCLSQLAEQHDNITPAILEVVVNEALIIPSHQRVSAKTLLNKVEQILYENRYDASQIDSKPQHWLSSSEDSNIDTTKVTLGRLSQSYIPNRGISPQSLMDRNIIERPESPEVQPRSSLGRNFNVDTTRNAPRHPSPLFIPSDGLNARNSIDQSIVASPASFSPEEELNQLSIANQLTPQTSPQSPPHARPHTATAQVEESVDKLTLQQIVDFRERKKRKLRQDAVVQDKIDELSNNLRGRDHLFAIEDSPSMNKHRDKIKKAFTALSYVAKGIDSDGVELVFASDPNNIKKSSHTRVLIEALDNKPFGQNQGSFEKNLDLLVDNIVNRLTRFRIRGSWKKPLSVLIFTDGCWGDNRPEAAGIQRPIKNLMRQLQEKGVSRTQVSIQFVRFGDDGNGKQYLNYLDDMGKAGDFDIVDTRSVNDDVTAIFWSSISEASDDS